MIILGQFKQRAAAPPARNENSDGMPSPLSGLPGREGCVGGIESLLLDGVRYYFGFSYKSDSVLSPLISDAEDMARFASRYMLQASGLHESGCCAHDPAYWREQVVESAGYSGLTDDDHQARTFTRAALGEFRQKIEQAWRTNAVVPELAALSERLGLPDGHLGYLLQTAPCLHIPIFLPEEVESLDDEDIAVLAGTRPLPAGATVSQVAEKILDQLQALVRVMPANWSILFGPLAGQTDQAIPDAIWRNELTG